MSPEAKLERAKRQIAEGIADAIQAMLESGGPPIATSRAPRYLTVPDVMAILKCKRTFAYALIQRIGPANLPDMVRVLESKFWAHLEGGERRYDEPRMSSAPLAPSRRAAPDDVEVPFTPRRVVRRRTPQPQPDETVEDVLDRMLAGAEQPRRGRPRR